MIYKARESGTRYGECPDTRLNVQRASQVGEGETETAQPLVALLRTHVVSTEEEK